MGRCSSLCDYSKFVYDVTEYKEEGKAAEEAVADAIGALPEGLVKSILTAHKAEATEMFLTEYDEEVVHQAYYNVGYEEGEAKANAKTAKAMLAKGMDDETVSECTSLSLEEVRKLKMV